MNNKELKEKFLSEMKLGISNVILGLQKEYENPFLSPADFEVYLKSKGIDIVNVEHESNGWEMDNWHTYTFEGRKFIIAGKGWYGGTSFSMDEDEDDNDEPEENIEQIESWE